MQLALGGGMASRHLVFMSKCKVIYLGILNIGPAYKMGLCLQILQLRKRFESHGG